MADETNNNRKGTDEQHPHYGRNRLWTILTCLSIVAILCIGAGCISVSAGNPALVSPENGQIQQQASSNTLTIRSTGDGRVTYSVTVSGTIQAGPGVDTNNAERPDAVSQSTAVGSVAEGGVDNFTFTGRITRLTLSGEAANVSINGKQIDPAKYQRTTAPQTPTPTPTPTATPTVTSTATPTATPTATAIPTVKTTPTVGYRPTVTATPVPTPTGSVLSGPTSALTASSTATPSLPAVTATSQPRTTSLSKTSSVPPSAPAQQSSGGGGSGILGWIASNLLLFGGFILLVILLVVVLVGRMNRNPRF
jgi:hypothetical protein